MKEIAISKVYRFFEQGSTLLLVTHDEAKPNVMTVSYHMMLDEGERTDCRRRRREGL
jgi:hypothetical protein